MGSSNTSYDFDGGYLGLGTGLISIFTKDTFSLTNYGNNGPSSGNLRNTYTGILFSGNIGYGEMIKKSVYLGAKASIVYTPLNGFYSSGFSLTPGTGLVVGDNQTETSFKPLYNIDAVLGYELYDHVLPYVEAGATWSGMKREYVLNRSITNLSNTDTVQYAALLSLNKYSAGYNVGMGINYQPHKNWFFSSELVYYGLGKLTASKNTAIPANNLIPNNIVVNTKIVHYSNVAFIVGLSYLFKP